MEVARQFLGGESVWVTAVSFALSGRQEVDGH